MVGDYQEGIITENRWNKMWIISKRVGVILRIQGSKDSEEDLKAKT
jgi:hypothetical protein